MCTVQESRVAEEPEDTTDQAEVRNQGQQPLTHALYLH